MKNPLTNAREYAIIVSERERELPQKGTNKMTYFYLAENFTRQYKNNGQNAEQWVRFTLTGKTEKADNIAHNLGTDCLNYQIKSARATVCKGTNLTAYLAEEVATEFIYATQNGIAYIMNKTEYLAFVEEFGTVTRESEKNGGSEKIRLKSESLALLAYLAERV